MIKLFTQVEFAAAKGRQYLRVQCEHCGAPFMATKRKIAGAINSTSGYSVKYCNQICAHAASKRQTTTPCRTCGQPVVRTPGGRKSSDPANIFCNRSCAAKWNNAHKKYGTRRSKLERWIAARLRQAYPALDIQFNRRDAIDHELDIHIPARRLAFELNGIYHYKPIHGLAKLASVQRNDMAKLQACRQAGIQLHVINVTCIPAEDIQQAETLLCTMRDIIDRT